VKNTKIKQPDLYEEGPKKKLLSQLDAEIAKLESGK
jgi:hypothetical protein